MLVSKEQEKTQQFVNQLFNECWNNEDFKNRLIASPVETLEDFKGQKLSPDMKKIVVSDQTDPNIIFINIPPRVNLDDLELSDEQLEMVSGGIVWPVVALTFGVLAWIDPL
ncbi:TOMM propeptide domain-containing protein [Phaeodactylibacter sp.]|uniref:TOMM propeptide domain-containing protein n=1 Tax=Phaeodactylibacter sp. TaxID=1940289 RepID=UPI0025CD37EB|nr:TOMM propeptide domain-containing protein [Phaeodactylibacter sp.]MCI4650685.1 TOMM propeptide domain-containing protein [Phaeodactylibacter sp.]MCI5093513.1 TOMM propeptide domain-containing protein [Phaeodactylibacter sp.]